jgi:homoserine O-acetyltransferase
MATAENDYVLKDYHFADGESLPELNLHYRTIGRPKRNPSTEEVENAIL